MNQQPLARRVQLPTMRNLFPQSPLWRKRNLCYRRVHQQLIADLTRKYNDNLVINLSAHPLTPLENEVLTKGLTFIPTPSKSLPLEREETLTRFKHTIKRQFHFRNENSDSTWVKHPFWVPSGWSPPEPRNENLKSFLQNISEAPSESNDHYPRHTNFTREQQQALRSLINNKNITIKPADKGGGICLLNTTDYIKKIMDHLNDTNTYRILDSNPIPEIKNEIKGYLDFLVQRSYIDKMTKEFLTPPDPPRLSPFYGIPKIHKPDHPLRPIVSGCESVTDRLSKYLTHFLQPLAEKLPSHIRDTTHFLRLLQDIPALPTDVFLVTADVTSLYTNIPHTEGIEASLHYITLHRKDMPSYTPPNLVFQTLLEFILKNSIFEFLDVLYHQTTGTSMGTRVAPPYANLFMGREEAEIINSFYEFIAFWKRFIDDIFFLFQGSEEDLKRLMDYMNSLHPSIKYTFEYSRSHVPFLDTIVYLDSSRKLQTTLYRKPTDRSCLLHNSSHHPRHVKESIVYTQALRYCTIISEDKNLEHELKELCKILLARGYPLPLITKQFSRALSHPRANLLYKNASVGEKTEVTPIITPFTPVGRATSRLIHEKWTLIEQDQHLHQIWPQKPVTAFTRGKNLKDLLVRSKQHKD